MKGSTPPRDRSVIAKLQRWAYASGHIEGELASAANGMYDRIVLDAAQHTTDDVTVLRDRVEALTEILEAVDAAATAWSRPAMSEPSRRAGNHLKDLLSETGLRTCPSCTHGARFHSGDSGCWFTVTDGKPARDTVCACSLGARIDAVEGDRAAEDIGGTT